jgi:hypothetical protein
MRLQKRKKMSHKISRLTIDLPSSEHKRLKMAASMLGTTMKELVIMSVEEFMHRKLNKVTEKTLKQSEAGKGLKKFNNMDELFEELGI